MAAPAPTSITVPTSFVNSYSTYHIYPSNLIAKSTYPAALRAFASRLDKFAHGLFNNGPSRVFFRDFTGLGPDGGLSVAEVADDAALKLCLGDQSNPTSPDLVLTKRDPKCRFVFITAESSRSPLDITREMLARLCTYHQVMAVYLDFLSVFGLQIDARDTGFVGFREQISFGQQSTNTEMRDLGRSGRQYALSYNLKTVTCKSEADEALSDQQWSIRQAAFHHQFDIEEGTTLWIVAQGKISIKERVQDMTAISGRPEDRAFSDVVDCFKTSLETQLLYCHWALEEWRWYIQWMEEVVQLETESALYSMRDTECKIEYKTEHLQMVQIREEKINESLMVLEGNTKIFMSLRDFYRKLLKNKDFDLRRKCQADVISFASQLDEMIYDSKMHIVRAELLLKKASDRKSLILQHLQGQTTEKMEQLTGLTVTIAAMAQRETIAMRIITVVTLVYLPATFVSTFFSTDIIKYQNPNSGNNNSTDPTASPFMGSFSDVALFRWLEVTLPLTALTLAIGWIAFLLSGKSADREVDKAQQLPFYNGDESKSSLEVPKKFLARLRVCWRRS